MSHPGFSSIVSMWVKGKPRWETGNLKVVHQIEVGCDRNSGRR